MNQENKEFLTKIEELDNQISEIKTSIDNAQGTETEVYTRIVGYYRVINSWNKGKRKEYDDRVTFSQDNNQTSPCIATILDEPQVKEFDNYILFYSDSCPNCPPVKKYLEDSSLKGELIDAATEAGIKKAQKYNIMSVPSVILFDEENNAIGKYNSLAELKEMVINKCLTI